LLTEREVVVVVVDDWVVFVAATTTAAVDFVANAAGDILGCRGWKAEAGVADRISGRAARRAGAAAARVRRAAILPCGRTRRFRK